MVTWPWTNMRTHGKFSPYQRLVRSTNVMDPTGLNSVRVWTHTTTRQPFYGPFSGTTRVSRCQKRTLNFMVQRKINRGRHTDHPAGCHSIQTNQYPPSPSPIDWVEIDVSGVKCWRGTVICGCLEMRPAWCFTRSRSGSRVGSRSRTTTSLFTVSDGCTHLTSSHLSLVSM